MTQPLYCFAKATISKCHRLGGLNNLSLFSHSSGGYKSKIKMSAGLIPSEGHEKKFLSGLLFALEAVVLSLCFHISFPPSVSLSK